MIVIKELSKTFPNGITAVDRATLHIAKGETVGLMGVNGAGKTTLIKLICGLYQPTDGYIRVFGEEPCRRKSKEKYIGLVTGQNITDGYNYHFGHAGSMLQDDLSLELNMALIQAIYRIPKAVYRQKTEELLTKLDLTRQLPCRVGQLSLGQRMKTEIAAVLLFQPALLILDEPFIGIDVTAREAIRAMLREIAREKETTVILTTHHVNELEAICQRVLLLDRGQILYDGSLDRLKQSHIGLSRMEIRFNGTPPDLLDFPIQRYRVENHTLTLYYDSGLIGAADLSRYLLSHGEATDILIRKPCLEDIVKGLHKEEHHGNH